MEGFISCNTVTGRGLPNVTGVVKVYPVTEENKLYLWKKMIESGLIPDEENDLYYRVGFGAWMGNTLDDRESIDDLIGAQYDHKLLGDTGYNGKNYSDYMSEGFELVLGPGSPVGYSDSKQTVGIYCKNYLELLEIQEHQKPRTM